MAVQQKRNVHLRIARVVRGLYGAGWAPRRWRGRRSRPELLSLGRGVALSAVHGPPALLLEGVPAPHGLPQRGVELAPPMAVGRRAERGEVARRGLGLRLRWGALHSAPARAGRGACAARRQPKCAPLWELPVWGSLSNSLARFGRLARLGPAVIWVPSSPRRRNSPPYPPRERHKGLARTRGKSFLIGRLYTRFHRPANPPQAPPAAGRTQTPIQVRHPGTLADTSPICRILIAFHAILTVPRVRTLRNTLARNLGTDLCAICSTLTPRSDAP